jgi:cytochrome c oxidase subunit 3
MHTEVAKNNMIMGMWVFIASEATLFVGLLWSCINAGIAPSVQVQMQWPPVGVHAIGWDGRALVMSAVLAASYYSANVAMVSKEPKTVLTALATTCGLGFMFLYDQYLEYNETPFTLTDSAYGSTFFITTGFHGMHVLLGAIFLACAATTYSRTKVSGVMLKSSVLYWHFVGECLMCIRLVAEGRVWHW